LLRTGVMSEEQELEWLGHLAGESQPPPSLRERVLAAARDVAFAFVMKDEGFWLPAATGSVEVKTLLADSRDRLATRLLHSRASSSLPAPPLDGLRAMYVVRGSLHSDDAALELCAGDFVEEFPPQPWSLGRDTMVVEWSQQPGGVTTREWQRSPTGPSHAAADTTPAPTAQLRPLSGNHGTPRALLELAMPPGATLDEHEHAGTEELFVLRGSCEVEGRWMGAGDYHRAAPHSIHRPTSAGPHGCVLLVALRDAERLGERA